MSALDLRAVEIKAFVPARDMAQSLQFYRELGFEVPWASDELAYLHAGDCSFLLQKFYVAEHAGNFMMHLLVADVDAWWAQVQAQRLPERYNVRALPPEDRPCCPEAALPSRRRPDGTGCFRRPATKRRESARHARHAGAAPGR